MKRGDVYWADLVPRLALDHYGSGLDVICATAEGSTGLKAAIDLE